jgi:hypothetical protein
VPVQTALWRITPAGLKEAQKSTLEREADLHKWIEADPKLISSDLMIVGSEVVTDYGGRIDLLAVDAEGILHVIELKRDKTPREVVAQALDYASWAASRTSENIADIYRAYKHDDLATAYQARFGSPIPETLNDDHSITIVASSLDASSERIVQYLSEYHGVGINAVFFSVFDDGNGQILTRTWLLDPQEVTTRIEDRSSRRVRGEWTGYYFVNVGTTTGEDRNWDDDRRYGIISAGQGTRYRNFMQKLEPGDPIFAYVTGKGYVGYGVVRERAAMAKDFRLADGQLLLDAELRGKDLRLYPDDEEMAEYVVAVDWKKTFDINNAKKFPGIFSIQQVVNKIYHAQTAQFLENQFDVTANLGK